MKPTVAVIGSGISGMASAYYLRRDFDVTLIDRNNYIGGHTNTITIHEGGRNIPIDTGFMVFNDSTYPNLVRLFEELGVTSYNTSMSFGVQNKDQALEFACGGFSSYFAQRKNLFKPKHWKLYRGILAFFKAADEFMAEKEDYELSVAEFARRFAIADSVVRNFILPMTAAIWSTPPERVLQSPALPLLRFMHNHRMLGIGIQLQWKTVEGGSDQYKEKLIAQLPREPQTNRVISRVGETEDSAYFYDENGQKQSFDHIIVATHANQALALLENPTPAQSKLLSNFKYNSNSAILHSDESIMPQAKSAWASWNVSHTKNENGHECSSTHYWMNSLQKIDSQRNYFVSIDYEGSLASESIHWQTMYTHPLFDTHAIKAQPQLHALNENGRIKFCGSYFRNGFHEDGLWSSLNVVRELMKVKGGKNELLPL
ncbi:FAD-dependent oxidoreductase [Puniceicoccaceae bacterium K14]|nr:FAD-dependent oxidoreductase [Puniceicoccaceae bacterium K14]